MIRLHSIVSDSRGIAIIAVTLVIVVGGLLGTAIISQTTQDVKETDRSFSFKQALFLAESGKERAYREIMISNNFTTLATPGVINNIPLQGGSYDLVANTLSDDPNPKIVEIVATGHQDAVDRQVTVVARVIRENVCVWNNAIFGGSGQTGGVINGNCAIYGSVHLLGDGVGEGNSSIEALDLNGTALIHNNYVGAPALLLSKVPPLPTTVFGGETVETLSAKLRVKNGAVGVSGNSEIGQPNVVGNTYKETMDGIYIETNWEDTRWSGNQVFDGVPDPAHVSSDNGTNCLYDLEDYVQMPRVNDPYIDDSSGTDVTYADYDTFFDEPRALTLPPLVLDGSNSAANTIQQYSDAGNFPAGTTVTVNGDSFTVTYGTNTISYDPTHAVDTALLTINGMIKIEGDLILGEKNLDILYDGRGTIYAAGGSGSVDAAEPGVNGDIDVHSHIIPVGIFPTDDVLGLVAKSYMYLADGPGDSNLYMAGAFYAGIKIKSTKQNQIAGTFVCDYFDMGTNVPKIYQVPELINNLPPGLIGSDPIWVTTGFEERSWRVD